MSVGCHRAARTALAAAAVVAGTLGVPAAGLAADAIAPVNGQLVPAEPTFAFDYTAGVALIELAKDTQVKPSGDDAGAFVTPVASDLALLSDRTPRDGLAPWKSGPLNAGRYFWHALARDDEAPEGGSGAWTPLRTLVVRDEPPVFRSWRVRARLLKQRSKKCRSIVRVTGAVGFTDNDEEPTGQLILGLRAGARRTELRAGVDTEGGDFRTLVCTRERRFVATPSLRDPGGNVTPGPVRTVTVRR